jgi:hypothetical protein
MRKQKHPKPLAWLAMASAIANTGCPVECEGVGCAELFTATRVVLFHGSALPALPLAVEDAHLRVDGDADQGPDFSAALSTEGLWIGAANSGEVLLIDSTPSETLQMLEDRVLFSIQGETPGDGHGRALVRVPDMDGDGLPELAVGAPEARGGGTHLEAGAAYLYLGASLANGTLTASDARLRILGEGAGDHLGSYLLACADLAKGDGPALLVGSPSNSEGAPLGGAVHVLAAADLPLLEDQVLAGVLDPIYTGEDPGGQLGRAMACLDGTRPGVALAAPHGAGSLGEAGAGHVYLLPGPLASGGPVQKAASLVLKGVMAGASLGHSLAAGDVDGDGLSELLAGAPGTEDGAGGAFLWTGEDLAAEITLPAYGFLPSGTEDRLGRAVAMADHNGDGHADVILGGPRANLADDTQSFYGAIWIFLGSSPPVWAAQTSAAEADITVFSPLAFGRTGETIVTGDANGDEAADLLLLLGHQP